MSKILVEEEMEIGEELPISVEPFTYVENWNVVKRLAWTMVKVQALMVSDLRHLRGVVMASMASFLASVTELWRKEIPLANGQSSTSFLSPRVDPSPTVTIIEVSVCAL